MPRAAFSLVCLITQSMAIAEYRWHWTGLFDDSHHLESMISPSPTVHVKLSKKLQQSVLVSCSLKEGATDLPNVRHQKPLGFNKVDVHVPQLFCALFNDVPQDEHLVPFLPRTLAVLFSVAVPLCQLFTWPTTNAYLFICTLHKTKQKLKSVKALWVGLLQIITLWKMRKEFYSKSGIPLNLFIN